MSEVPTREDEVLNLVRRLPPGLEQTREMLLANLIMLGEVPAPTFHERERIELLVQRFTECGLTNCSIDEAGNALAVMPGSVGSQKVLITAHADTPFPETIPHTMSVDKDRITGPGVADNSLGLAVLATLPTMLEHLKIRLRSDVVFMGATKSLGRGNLEGLRFFLSNSDLPIKAGISVEGAQLGRLHYASLATLDGEISCHVSSEAIDGEEPTENAILALVHVIDRIRDMPLPEASTRVVLGSVEGGTSYKTPARSALLCFQVRSESDEALATVEKGIRGIVQEAGRSGGVKIEFRGIARTKAGGINSDHPLILHTRRIMAALGIQPRSDRFSSTVSSFIEHDIPSITLGVSRAVHLNERNESVFISPMSKGLAQLIGVLLMIDGGCCDRY